MRLSIGDAPRHEPPCATRKTNKMVFVTGSSGWIEASCGPMFSGKSEELMHRLRRAMIARKRVQVFKPIIDERYSKDEIVSHTDTRMPSEAIQSVSNILVVPFQRSN
jgi:thymidine kinase